MTLTRKPPAEAPTERSARHPVDHPSPTLPRRQVVHGGLLAGAAVALAAAPTGPALAAANEDLEKDAARALGTLYRRNPTAEAIGKKARGILVFPKIVKAGLVFGGSYGEGVLMQGGRVTGHFNSVSASWGWQAGAQTYSYVLFLMTDAALRYLDETKGWEIGVGPTVVVVHEGVARNLSTQTLKDDAYAFISDQQGLMVSLSIEGTKITRLKR
jgi:lipid-binding SYLF domain-containing protein